MAWAALVTASGFGVLLASERSGSPVRFAAKPAASGGFIAVALAAGAVDSSFGKWMLAGLLLAALGDVFLLGKSEAAFLAGLGSFLVSCVVSSCRFRRAIRRP